MNRILAFFLTVVMVLSALSGCGNSQGSIQIDASELDRPGSDENGLREVYEDGQLMCEAESRREAEEIAELYGITLVEFLGNVAVFYTEENPDDVIRRGQENDWPELSLNFIVTAY